MRLRFAASVLSLAALSPGPAAADPLVAKKAAWQQVLERDKFRFSETNTGVMFSLTQYRGDCRIHLIHDPKKQGLMFRFERDGKDVLTFYGHPESVFRTVENTLYFAHFSPSSCGCTVAAYDLTTGKKTWETRLTAIGDLNHSGYLNQVTMGVSRLTDLDKEGEGVVSITGRESSGDYIEILDRATGKVLAHKVYRKEFGPAK